MILQAFISLAFTPWPHGQWTLAKSRCIMKFRPKPLVCRSLALTYLKALICESSREIIAERFTKWYQTDHEIYRQIKELFKERLAFLARAILSVGGLETLFTLIFRIRVCFALWNEKWLIPYYKKAICRCPFLDPFLLAKLHNDANLTVCSKLWNSNR